MLKKFLFEMLKGNLVKWLRERALHIPEATVQTLSKKHKVPVELVRVVEEELQNALVKLVEEKTK